MVLPSKVELNKIKLLIREICGNRVIPRTVHPGTAYIPTWGSMNDPMAVSSEDTVELS